MLNCQFHYVAAFFFPFLSSAIFFKAKSVRLRVSYPPLLPVSSCLFFVSISHIATNDFSTWRFVFAAFDFVAAPRTVFLWFFAKRKLDSTGTRKERNSTRRLLSRDSETRLDARVRWRVQQTFNWLAGRACASPCLVLPRLGWFFDLQYTWEMSFVSGEGATRPASTPECFAYLLARVNKLSVRAVIVNYILRGSYARKSAN